MTTLQMLPVLGQLAPTWLQISNAKDKGLGLYLQRGLKRGNSSDGSLPFWKCSHLSPHAPQPSSGDGEGDVCLVLSWQYVFGEELACEDRKIKEHQQMPSHSEGLHPAIWLPDLQSEKFQGPNFKLRLFELV